MRTKGKEEARLDRDGQGRRQMEAKAKAKASERATARDGGTNPEDEL